MTLQPTDIAIFLISTAACIYCIVLSRRLKALQNNKDGLGATIMAFSESVSAMSNVTKETRVQTGELAGRLAQLMEEAKATCTRIEDLTSHVEDRRTRAMEKVDRAQAELNTLMRSALEEAETRMNDMQVLTKQMRALTDGTTADIIQAIHRAAELQAQPQKTLVQHNDPR